MSMMMDKKWAQGSVAGVSTLVSGDPCRCYFLDGANLQPRRFVNQRVAADGKVYTQGFSTGGKNAHFGLEFANMPVSMFQGIVDSINAATDNSASFLVEMADDWQSVSMQCVVDGSSWLTYPKATELTNSQFIANVTMRFITV